MVTMAQKVKTVRVVSEIYRDLKRIQREAILTFSIEALANGAMRLGIKELEPLVVKQKDNKTLDK